MADLNDLQREWDSQPEYSEEKMNEIAELVRTRSGSMRSRLFARDLGETIASIFVIIVFGGCWFFATNAVTKIGIGIIVVGALEIIALLQIVQRRGRADFTSVPLKSFLLSEVRMLNRQISLLRHVAWWYLLPLYAGACVFTFGVASKDNREGERAFFIWFCVGYFIFCAFVWWLNQTARKKTLEPLRDAMQRTYDSLTALDSGSPVHDGELVDALTNPALDADCRGLRFVRPSWRQLVVIVFACIAGVFAGVLIQLRVGAPMRYGEWPLLGLMVAAVLAIGSFCLRRKGADE